MKLEKLLALIRLANHNPDENEANLAARKVCKILAIKTDDRLNEFDIVPRQIRTAAGKMNEARTWNDVKRSTEPQWRSASNPNSSAYNPFDEFFKRYAKNPHVRYNGFDWSKAPEKDAPEPDYEPPRYKPDPPRKHPDQDFDWVTGNRKKKERPQEKRKCSKCGLEIMTFRIKEDPWVCNFCHWKDYP